MWRACFGLVMLLIVWIIRSVVLDLGMCGGVSWLLLPVSGWVWHDRELSRADYGWGELVCRCAVASLRLGSSPGNEKPRQLVCGVTLLCWLLDYLGCLSRKNFSKNEFPC